LRGHRRKVFLVDQKRILKGFWRWQVQQYSQEELQLLMFYQMDLLLDLIGWSKDEYQLPVIFVENK
jgi:hypothetical protein